MPPDQPACDVEQPWVLRTCDAEVGGCCADALDDVVVEAQIRDMQLRGDEVRVVAQVADPRDRPTMRSGAQFERDVVLCDDPCVEQRSEARQVPLVVALRWDRRALARSLTVPTRRQGPS